MADHFSLIMSCIDSVSDRVRGGNSKIWQLNEHQCSYLAEELLKVSQSLQAKLESGNFKPVRGIQKIVLLHFHAAVKRAQLLVERCCCETSASWRVAAMTSLDIKEEVITIVLDLHRWTSMLDIAIASVEGRPSEEKLEILKTGEEGYQRLFKKLHSSKHPLQVAALQDHKTLLENIVEYSEDEYAYGVYLKSRLAPMGEVQSLPQLEDYRILRTLGQGASGMVLEVTWMGHQCGLKISKGSDKAEATILDRLHHPNIVRFFHYWEVPPPDRNS